MKQKVGIYKLSRKKKTYLLKSAEELFEIDTPAIADPYENSKLDTKNLTNSRQSENEEY